MSIEIICDSGYSAREWISKDGERHNIFIKDKNGEVGWIDLKTGKLVNKSQRNYDFVDEDDAKIIIKASDKKLFVGIVGDDEVDEMIDDLFGGDDDDDDDAFQSDSGFNYETDNDNEKAHEKAARKNQKIEEQYATQQVVPMRDDITIDDLALMGNSLPHFGSSSVSSFKE